MNKQQYGSGPSGLPVRPSATNMPGPAPPLPPGPPPPQPPYSQQQQPQQDQAAHAAAWAAYYQSQAQAAGGAYTGPAQPAAGAGAANPYANYGYSALASAQHSAHVQQPQYQAPPASAPYRPPPAQTYPQAGPAQPYPTQPYVQGYPQQPQQYPQQYPQQPAQPYNWQQSGAPGQPVQQPYRPPAAGPGPQQPYYPQQNQPYSPVRPSPTPGPTAGQHRPYQPAPRVPSTTGRPPLANSPSHPPAKRQRFDGPGGPPSGPANSNNNYGNIPMQNRPPQQNVPPIRPSGPPGNNTNIRPPPNFPVRPLPASLPSAPRSATGHSGSTPNKPNLPAPPVVREPIHMGFGPPPSLAPSGLGGGGRGGGGGGRGGHAGPRSMRGGRGGGNLGAGLANAPRGPAQMRRGHDHSRSHRDRDRDRENNDRKRREKSKDVGQKEDKTTLTDFRIVGIEVKSLGWTWGQIGHEVNDDDREVEGVEDDPVIASEPAAKVEAETVKEEEAANLVKDDVKTEEESGSNEVEKKEESDSTSEAKAEAPETSEAVEKKRGEKRKAKTPEGDEDAASPKKRSGFHLLTHGKPNETSSAASATAIHEFNQNRFRIYFESPAELDRVPKAMRRNPNKRWRRGTSSVAPALVGQEATSQTARESTVATQATLEEVGEEVQASETTVVDGESAGEAAKDGDDVEASHSAEEALKTANDQTTDTAEEAGTALATEAHAQPDIDEVAPQLESNDAITQSTEDAAAPVTVLTEAVEDQTTVQDAPDIGDISMVTDPGILAAAIDELVESAQTAMPEGESHADANDTAQEIEAPTIEIPQIKVESTEEKPTTNVVETEKLAQSAENTASAYKSRTRRRSSVSSNGSNEDLLADLDIPTPSLNRISILYQESQRRLCFDASVISSMTIDRAEAKIDLEFKKIDKDGGVPKGVLAEYYDMEDQRFAALSGDKLADFEKEASSSTLPPFHRASFEAPVVLTVYVNKKRPLSEPKWCRMNTADEWLVEQFGAVKAKSETGWMGKLKVADPDPPPTLQTILEGWASSSMVGSHQDRKSFTKSLQSDPSNLLEILLRLARGERNPSATASSSSSNGSLGPLATAIRADSPYASHQTHVSLAILAMYRLTTDYAAKAGEKSEVVNEKISDIIKSLPEGMIHRSLDGLYKEWQAK